MLSRRIGVLVCVLLLAAACGSSGGASKPTAPTRTTTRPTANPDGTTLMGTTLALGKRATVRYRAHPRRDSILSIRVVGVRSGRLRDLRGFTLGPRARSSSVFYASVKVRNVGTGDLGGQSLPLYAKVTDSLVVPPVSFGSAFPRCQDPRFHRPFRKNAHATLCMVFLAPRHGTVSAIQWRIPSSPNAISWVLH